MKAAWRPDFIPSLQSIDMPFHPNNSTALPPAAPRAAPGARFDPWACDDLDGTDRLDLEGAILAELEFTIAPRQPVPPSEWMIAPAQRPSVIEITTHMPAARPSDQETFSPLHLRRAGVQDDPLASPAMTQPGMRDIAGTPLNSPPAGSHPQRIVANGFSYSDELLSSPGGNHPPLNLPSPEFDSIHQVMRIPRPPESMVPPSMPGQPVSSMLGNLPEIPGTPDSVGFQADIAMPAFSMTFNIATLTPARPTTTTTTTSTPQSAPPILERLPAVPPAHDLAHRQDDHVYLHALVSERSHLSLLESGLGELHNFAPGGQETQQLTRYVFDAYETHLRNRQLAVTETARDGTSSDTSSDDEAVEFVGSPPNPHAM
ncbi:hypothetical protein [Comamonas antarctica]|uniref:Uncharacterized protein n=1 Tax=Comamonas antarctica TaxID=2743470 RepID=A0A6N1WXU4_9BURK|nr:hypothetical protein [Comamonas antarctica]QKV51468.1 hypothetical protein HUK68_00395 [Comamonas antarctica]